MLSILTRKLVITITAILLSTCAMGAYDPNNFDPDNAAHLYRKAFALYEKPEGLDLNEYIFDDAAVTPELEQYLKKQKPVIDLVIKASQIERCDWEYDRYEDIWKGSNDYSYTVAKCWLVILADTRFSEGSSAPSEVIEKCRLCINSAQHIYLPNYWDHIISTSLKGRCFSFIRRHLNRHSEVTTADLEKLNKLLLDEYKRKPITLNDLLDNELSFAKIALTKHKDKKPENDPFVVQIIDFKGEAGWEDFFSSSLSFYEKRIATLRTVVNLPRTLRYWMITQVEQSFSNECESYLEKYYDLPDDFIPTQKDYDDFIEGCGYAFAVVNDPPIHAVYQSEMKSNTARNALLTGIPLMLEYRKTGKLPENVPLTSPKDAFGNQSFELIKTETGFTLKSKSIDVRNDKRHEYEFRLQKK